MQGNGIVGQPQNPQQPVMPQTNAQPMQQAQTMATTQATYQQNLPSNSNISTSDITQVVETDKRGRAKKPIISYRYTVINGMGKKETGTFDAENDNDVRNFFLSLNYQVLEVKERSKLDVDISGGKFSASDLSFALTQLSTYLKAGIALADAVKILAKQSKKPNIRKSFYELVYQLLKGESLSEAMDMQAKVFPKLLINMVKTAEMTGDLPSILDDMSEYYTSIDQTRKQMKSAMTYPVIVLVIAIGVLVFMLVYLVPQFSSLFESNGAELPALTKAVMGVSGFIQNNWLVLIISILVVVFVFYELYVHVQKFRETVQIVLMHFPVFKDIIIYNEIANFTKTFASLLNHGVFITDSMEILSKITNNEIYKRIIHKTLENLGKGDSISTAFKGEWAVPVVAYEMIVTGETTGQLGQMMEKVAAHFQSLHKNVINQMKSLVEPLLMCFLAVVVGIILLSIIQPMFSIYSQIK
ncbi:MAG: type II secretion system F family protein [Bacilli bacterium]|nr:type II secretion system F family protein [Bacilli bacterium]